MRNIYQTILFGLFAVSCIQSLYSQDRRVSYGYDAAGNRVSRTITVNSLRSAPAPQEESTVYSEMLSDIELRIYPNPTDGLLQVELHNLPENQNVDISLYDLSGKLIRSHRGVSGFTTVDISDSPAGTYLMKIAAGNYQTEWKIIKN